MTKKVKIKSVCFDTNFLEYEYRPIFYAIEWFKNNVKSIQFQILNKEDDQTVKIKLKGDKRNINNTLCDFLIANGKWYDI